MIDAYASQVTYLRHLAPIFNALPAEMRGHVYLGLGANELGPACVAEQLPFAKGTAPGSTEPILIAGGIDLIRANGRPVVFIEHGAGQSYVGQGADNAGYTGGRGRDQVQLFLTPNERTAAANLARYPNAQAAVVGDPTIGRFPFAGEKRTTAPPVVGVTFHFDLPGLVPETRWSWPNWQNAIEQLAKSYTLIGHAHPRAQRQILPWYYEHGIGNTDDFDVLNEMCDLLIVDNSSAGPEFARTGRPILWLNAPHYRRDVEHLGRFWEWTEWAPACDRPRDLPRAVADALADTPERAEARAAATAVIYPYVGEEAAQAAVRAVLDRWG